MGRELNQKNAVKIRFIEADIFDPLPTKATYDYIILMNLLHDFDDEHCLKILTSCTKVCHCQTSFILIEDTLLQEFKPKAAIMHGLRLAVACRGGRQRTISEMEKLFAAISYKVAAHIPIDTVHSMTIMEAK